ncbi:hypothetical protein ROSI111154_14475 [Rouxiella silvae]
MGVNDRSFTGGKTIRELRLIAILICERGILVPLVSLEELPCSYLEQEKYLKIKEQAYEKHSLREILESTIKNNFRNPGEVSEFENNFINVSERYLLAAKKFSWLNENSAGYWLWCYLRNESAQFFPHQVRARFHEKHIFNPFNGELLNEDAENFLPQNYDHTGLTKSPNNYSELLDSIIGFFDHWIIALVYKKKALDILKSKWSFLLKWEAENGKPFAFLDKNDKEGGEWCWEYFRKKVTVIRWGQFQPASTLERYSYLTAIFYVWDVLPEARKVFLTDINRAWSQRKFRISQNDRKAFQTYMKEDTKRKLLELSKVNGMKINEVLEAIINDAYSSSLNLSK